MAVLEDIFLNFLIVLSPLFFYHTIFSSTIMKTKEQIKFGIICGVATALCMQFPIVFDETFLWDFRWIPFVVAIIYGGRIPGAITGLILLIFRYILGGFLAWFIVLVSVLILYVTFIWLRKRIQQHTLVRKLMYGFFSALYTYMVAFSGIFVYFLSQDNIEFIYQQGILLYVEMFASYVLTMLIFIYFTENFMINLKVQENVHQAEKLNLISELAASMAHEVRNPLTVVRGFIQLIGNKLGAHEKEYITISITELDRAESIITNYLNFAKPHLDTNGEIQVGPVIDELLLMMTPYANMQEVELSQRVEEYLIVEGDSIKFKQVLLNIIKNAIEATKDKKEGIVHVEAYYWDNDIYIQIKDNGIGMSSDELVRIGKPFYTTKTKGTGLGMMVTLRLVEALNGSIDIRSFLHEGTEVVLRLPARSIR